MTAPCVLGLDLSEAESRLGKAGITDIAVIASGRRREGRPRVIRQGFDGKVELVISYFKELKVPT